MSASGPPGLSLDELERRVKAADPAVLLLPARMLRRVIKHDLHLPGIGLQVPHRKSYVCARDRLFGLVESSELGVNPEGLPETLLLLTRPDPDTLAKQPADVALTRAWRVLFHSRVHQALEKQSERLNDPGLCQRIQRIGRAEFEEARTVLRQDNFLLPPGDDHATYIEFAAVYLELRHFSPEMLAQCFPGIAHPAIVDAVLAEDLDVAALLAGTRPEGAPDPVPVREEPSEPVAESAASIATDNDLLPRADAAAAAGNVVRAAMLRERAAAGRPDQAAALRAAARADLDRLAHRLQAALQLHRAEAESWRQVLPALLPLATSGFWPVAARLLYDLQSVCIDHEKAVYTVDLVEWARSLGRRPIKRLLPGQQEVLALKHLRSALRRLTAARLDDADRRQLAGLLLAAIHHSEERLRDRFRPILTGTLEEVGLTPANLPERVARNKLVEELLDRVAERGFINISDLRDALSRNQLKLPDLSGPRQFLFGDALLLIDDHLAVVMEGAYRRGEFYLRWLQRFSSVGFGTRVGRFLTRYVALPFGGAFVILEALQHVVEPLMKVFGEKPDPAPQLEEWQGIEPPPEVKHSAEVSVHLLNSYSLVLLAFFLMGLLYVPAFRRQVVRGLGAVWHGLRLIFYDGPRRLVETPFIQRFMHSRGLALAWQFFLKPLLLAVGGAFLLLEPTAMFWPVGFILWGPGPEVWLTTVGGLFVIAVLFLNSRTGRDLEERITDEMERTSHRVLHGFLPGLFYLVMDFFRAIMEAIERLLYTVDERLRFRSGDNRLLLYVKPVLGLIWCAVAYVVRFCVNLLIEPQINPIKHFPVVTVSHKLVLTMGVPMMARGLAFTFNMDLRTEAIPTATVIGFLIPGIFGFLVWELKENWKLYRANRPEVLRPAMVGSHGETLVRLLRPGFHSGTIPKLFAKLRKARRRAERRGRWSAYRKQRDALHHVEEAVHQFVERVLLRLLEESKAWGGLHVQTGEVVLSTNRIRVELHCPELGSEPLWLSFTEQAGDLSAAVDCAGWLPRLAEDQRQALTLALAGQYKLSGVDLVGDGTKGVAFRDVSIRWDDWVSAWANDQEGKPATLPLPPGLRLLPGCAAEAVV